MLPGSMEQSKLSFAVNSAPISGGYRRAIVGGTSEFLGQLLALLLVAQWLECWCASLVAQVSFLACLVQSQLLQWGT